MAHESPLITVTRRFEKKNCPIFQKAAQTVSKPKKAKISTAKLNLKAQNIYINHF
jgi:hypothetical protein